MRPRSRLWAVAAIKSQKRLENKSRPRCTQLVLNCWEDEAVIPASKGRPLELHPQSICNWRHFPHQKLVENWLLSLDAWCGVDMGMLPTAPRPPGRSSKKVKRNETAFYNTHMLCSQGHTVILWGLWGGPGKRNGKPASPWELVGCVGRGCGRGR